MIYNQLATQRKKAITGGEKWVNQYCPYCIDTPETFQHLLRCQHPEAPIFRENLLKTINTICIQRRAPKIIRTTLYSWISAWLTHETPTRETLDPRLHLLYDAQSTIGWDLMLRGFFANEWSTVNNRYQPHRTTPYNNDFLFPKIIADIWQHQLDFWNRYQQHRHSNDASNPSSSTNLTELQAHVRHLHTLADTVLPAQRHRLFHEDVEHYLTTHTAIQLKNYIDTYGPAIRLSARQAIKRARQNTRSLFEYGFGPLQPTETNTIPATPLPQTPQQTNLPDPSLTTTPVPTPPTQQPPRFHQRILNWTRIPSVHTTPHTTTTTQHSPRVQNPSRPTASPDDHPNQPQNRAIPHKHTRWRSIALQKQRFLSFFRR